MVKYMNITNRILKEFNNSPDIKVKSYSAAFFRKIDVVYMETTTSSDKVNELILKNLVNIINLKKNIGELVNLIAGANTLKVDNLDKLEFYLTNGFALVIEKDEVYAVEARLNVFRSVSSPQVQASVNGPKDAFVENSLMNIGLIKRRIKSSKLMTKTLFLGRKTNTAVSILYLEDITDPRLVKRVYSKIKDIDIDGIIDSSELAHLIDGESRSIFPTIKYDERPDTVSKAILQGKIAIVVDNSTFVLVTPCFFIDFFHPATDMYTKSINVNFVKILRMIAFFLTIMGPGLYIAIVNYNQEAIPTNLLLNFAAQREGLPFPAFIEALIILIISEILRESDLRFPSAYGSSISILGALVLGEAAVSAGIVSPIMIIVIALTFVSSLIFTDIDMINATRYYRFIFLLAAAFLGLYGWVLILFLLLIKVTSTYSLGKVYTTPLAPFDLNYFKSVFFKADEAKNKKRSSALVQENYTRES